MMNGNKKNWLLISIKCKKQEAMCQA